MVLRPQAFLDAHFLWDGDGLMCKQADLGTRFSSRGQKVKRSPYLIRLNAVHVYFAHNYFLL